MFVSRRLTNFLTNLPDWNVGNIPSVHSYHVRDHESITNPLEHKIHYAEISIFLDQNCPDFLSDISWYEPFTNIFELFWTSWRVRNSSYHERITNKKTKKCFVSRTKEVRNTKKWSSYHEKKWFGLRNKGVRIT